MSRRVTMRDIAREAGVSVAAVSHAYNNPSQIAADLRERILQIADKHGYQPDPRARALRRGESKLIAFVVSSLASHYFGPLANAIQQTIAGQGYHLVVLSSYGTLEGERESLETIKYERMAGAIVDLYQVKPGEARRLVPSPIVMLADHEQVFEGPSVRVDNFRGAYEAVEYLAGRGYRRIAHITGPVAAYNASRRRTGYYRAIIDLGLGPPLEVEGDFSAEAGARAMATLLDREERPDAVFAANDDMALGALAVLRQRQIAVPQCVAVMGFDNVPEGSRSVPTLSTIEQPTAQIGVTAANLLLSAIREPTFQATTDIACTLIQRESA